MQACKEAEKSNKFTRIVQRRDLPWEKDSITILKLEIFLHDEISIIDSALFKTTQGTTDPMNTDSLNRVGDEVNLRGISIRFILEMPVYMSDVTYRAMIIKSAKGDVSQMATLWNGLSPCKLPSLIQIRD
jgi:hypothetical protein